MVATICYANSNQQVTWQGVQMPDDDNFDAFVTNDVSSRLYDEEGESQYETHLRGLANTGFERENLDDIFASDTQEERDWAIGEAAAEAYLSSQHNIVWPWNMERDKRTPLASLPGADLVGFEVEDAGIRLVLGEVKSSSDINAPPNVMYGRSGMTHQIDKLVGDLGLVSRLLKWLLHRCKGTEYESYFNEAVIRLLQSSNKDIAFFGVLIRDTVPNEQDLRSRGNFLARKLQAPSNCKLLALHFPCKIADLPAKVSGGATL